MSLRTEAEQRAVLLRELLNDFALQVVAHDFYRSSGNHSMADLIESELLAAMRVWLSGMGRPVTLTKGGEA